MNTKVSEFIKFFNQLENEMGILTDTKYERDTFNRTTFLKKLQVLRTEEPKYEHFRSDLEELSELRNVLVYEYKHEADLAVPSDWAINRLKEILNKLKNPQTAYSIASKPVDMCKLDYNLGEVIAKMSEKNFTHVPVVDKDDKFAGVISESVIVSWTADFLKGDKKNLSDTKVSDIIALIKEPINNYWIFIAMNTDGFKILSLFQEYLENNKRLGAIFVTKTGNSTEKIMGIVTAWDLGRIQK